MRIFVAGATGVIGSRLVPMLIAAGHEVTGMTRTPHKAESLRHMGARPVVCDVFDSDRLLAEVTVADPEVVVHQLTDLPDEVDRIPSYADRHARIRTLGTANLLAAASAAGADRVIAQSVAWTIPGAGGDAVASLERQVLDYPGIVLRYGQFYGPSTYHVDDRPPAPRIHVDAAAEQTLAALSMPAPEVVTIAEADPSPPASR
jgi:nucleoside-diphosphate-sugar epimerase